MSVPAAQMAPPPAGPPPGALPPGGPPLPGGAPPGQMPMPTSMLAMLATQMAADVQQKEEAAQSALVQLAAQLSANPNPASAQAVSQPGPVTAVGSAGPSDPNAPGGYQ